MVSGIQFFPDIGPAVQSGEDYWADALHLVELCDALGYTHVRTVEHYFNPYGGYSPNPIVFLTAASQRCQQARLVTGAVLPVFNNPLKLAGEIGMLDAISHGRLDVGFARAFLPHEFARFGVSLDESKARFAGRYGNGAAFTGGGRRQHRGTVSQFQKRHVVAAANAKAPATVLDRSFRDSGIIQGCGGSRPFHHGDPSGRRQNGRTCEHLS